MRQWSLRLVFSCTGLLFSAEDPEASEVMIDGLYAGLPESLHGCSIGQDKHGNLDFQLTAEAPTLAEAIASATQASKTAAEGAGISDVDLIEVEAMTWEMFTERLGPV